MVNGVLFNYVVNAFEGWDHRMNASGAFHTPVDTSVCHLCYHLLNWPLVIPWIQKLIASEFPRCKNVYISCHTSKSPLRPHYVAWLYLLRIELGSDQHQWSWMLRQFLLLQQPRTQKRLGLGITTCEFRGWMTYSEADSSKSKDSNRWTLFRLCNIQSSTKTCGNAAAKNTDFVERGSWVDLG